MLSFDFTAVLETVERAIDTVVSEAQLLVKLMVISDAEKSVEIFAEFYKKLLPQTVVADLNWVLEQARETIIILWLEANNK